MISFLLTYDRRRHRLVELKRYPTLAEANAARHAAELRAAASETVLRSMIGAAPEAYALPRRRDPLGRLISGSHPETTQLVQEAGFDPDLEVVVLEAPSEKHLRTTHPRYFGAEALDELVKGAT